VRDGHSILGKSTGLIGANARGGSEGLDGFEILNQHHLTGHSLGSQSKGYCDGGEKTFWDVSDNNTNCEH